MKDPGGDGNILHLDCVPVSSLVVILCYSFAQYYHWGKWGNKSLCIISYNCWWLIFFLFLIFLVFFGGGGGAHPQQVEVPRLGVKTELRLPAYARAIAMRDQSHICDLYHSSWQHQILNPLNKARDRT